MERVTGIEPASPAWKAGALAIVLHPLVSHMLVLVPQQQIVSLDIIAYSRPFVNKIFHWKGDFLLAVSRLRNCHITARQGFRFRNARKEKTYLGSAEKA